MRASVSKYFFEGYSRALNLGGKKEWPDIYGDRTKDYNALRSDWCNVGNAIREGTDQFKREAGSIKRARY